MKQEHLLVQLQQLLWLLDSKQHGLVPSPLLQGHVVCDVCQLPVDQALEPQENKLESCKAVRREQQLGRT